MKKIIIFSFFVFCSCLLVVAQDQPKTEIFGGYQWVSVDSGADFDRLNFNGWDAAVSGYFNNNIGITADFSGAYKTEQGVSVKVHTFMFGPSFRAPMEKATPFFHALFGGAHANAGAFDIGVGENSFAYALGGGLDINASKHVAIRIAQFDFLGTRFGGDTQKNFRYSGGIVLKF